MKYQALCLGSSERDNTEFTVLQRKQIIIKIIVKLKYVINTKKGEVQNAMKAFPGEPTLVSGIKRGLLKEVTFKLRDYGDWGWVRQQVRRNLHF